MSKWAAVWDVWWNSGFVWSTSSCSVLQTHRCYSELCAPVVCLCQEVIFWCRHGNNSVCRGGTLVVLTKKKPLKSLSLVFLFFSFFVFLMAEPSGSESHVLLLTFFIWLRGKTVFDLCGGVAAGIWPKTAGCKARVEVLVKPRVAKSTQTHSHVSLWIVRHRRARKYLWIYPLDMVHLCFCWYHNLPAIFRHQ